MNLKFGKEVIEFKNGKAEVTEEVFTAIIKSGFPNIFQEGKLPGVKSSERKDYDSALKDVNEEYMIEIDRLKGIIANKNQEISEIKAQVNVWKDLYNKDVPALKAQLAKVQVNPSTVKEDPKPEETKPSMEDDEAAVRADLEAMKLTELQSLALKEGLEESKVKKAGTKKVLIDLIMGKIDEVEE